MSTAVTLTPALVRQFEKLYDHVKDGDWSIRSDSRPTIDALRTVLGTVPYFIADWKTLSSQATRTGRKAPKRKLRGSKSRTRKPGTKKGRKRTKRRVRISAAGGGRSNFTVKRVKSAA